MIVFRTRSRAKGARAPGVECDPDTVALSRRSARKAGVADRATFVEGGMYEADVSEATPLILSLLPHNLERLAPRFLDTKPGSRVVDDTCAIPGREAGAAEPGDGECQSWCAALMWIVPAKVHGTRRLPAGEIAVDRKSRMLTGTIGTASGSVQIENGRLRGEEIAGGAGGDRYTGRVSGDAIQGQERGSSRERARCATRTRSQDRLAVGFARE